MWTYPWTLKTKYEYSARVSEILRWTGIPLCLSFARPLDYHKPQTIALFLTSVCLPPQSRQYEGRSSSKPRWWHIQSGRMRSTVSYPVHQIPYLGIRLRCIFQSSGGYVASSKPPRGVSDDERPSHSNGPRRHLDETRGLIRKQRRTCAILSPKWPDIL